VSRIEFDASVEHEFSGLSLFRARHAAAAENVIHGDGAGAKKNESEGDDGQRQRKLESVIASETVVQMYLPDGDSHVNADSEGGGAGEESGEHEQSAKKFSKGGKITGPYRKSEAGDEVGMLRESAENFVIAVYDHYSAQSQAQE
jgi:hypothetical protein